MIGDFSLVVDLELLLVISHHLLPMLTEEAVELGVMALLFIPYMKSCLFNIGEVMDPVTLLFSFI